jgi:transketolase N-terminal domain/subunit
MKPMDDIRELAQQLRVDSIRCSTSAGSGHPTSSMSAADLMAVLLTRPFRRRPTAAGQSGQRPPDFFEGARLRAAVPDAHRAGLTIS